MHIAFGGGVPLKPESYRFTVPFKEATQLAIESDVRISGVSVGKVKKIELSDDGFADATIEIDPKFAPIPADRALKQGPYAAIAAPVRRGSVVIPLVFLAGDAQQFVLTAMPTMTARNFQELQQWLSTLADVTDLFDFALGYVFGRQGALARQ